MTLRDSDGDVVLSTIAGLSRLARSLEGAQDMIDADVFDCLTELLNSRDADVRTLTAEIFWMLATHDFALEQASGHSL
jgi:hypothetical protein